MFTEAVTKGLSSKTITSPIGDLVIVGNEDAITGIYMTESRGHPPDVPELQISNRVIDDASEQLRSYFAGELRVFDLPLAPRGTRFQVAVWDVLFEIPFGKTQTYGEVAAEIGNPKAARAVGVASSRNPIAIIVACHRVIGSTGSLIGYAGGLHRKQILLDHERNVFDGRILRSLGDNDRDPAP